VKKHLDGDWEQAAGGETKTLRKAFAAHLQALHRRQRKHTAECRQSQGTFNLSQGTFSLSQGAFREHSGNIRRDEDAPEVLCCTPFGSSPPPAKTCCRIYTRSQGTFSLIQGTFNLIQGTFSLIQGTFSLIQGTFSLIQGTFRGTKTLRKAFAAHL
jgi:hypothetical protein